MIGIHTVIEPVGSMSNSAPEPLPFCQKTTMNPQTAAIEMTLKMIALRGRRSERNTRASRMYVINRIRRITQMKLP